MWGTLGCDSDRKLHRSFVGRPALGRRSSLPQDDRGDASQIRADAVYISVLENFGLELL